jgi:hypothetical protein
MSDKRRDLPGRDHSGDAVATSGVVPSPAGGGGAGGGEPPRSGGMQFSPLAAEPAPGDTCCVTY